VDVRPESTHGQALYDSRARPLARTTPWPTTQARDRETSICLAHESTGRGELAADQQCESLPTTSKERRVEGDHSADR
jgi:hypothetical protein